jgi:hypothetical protein
MTYKLYNWTLGTSFTNIIDRELRFGCNYISQSKCFLAMWSQRRKVQHHKRINTMILTMNCNSRNDKIKYTTT